MSARVKLWLLVVIAIAWFLNAAVFPIVIDEWRPDPTINAVFMLVAGYVYAQTPKKTKGEDND